MLRVGDDVRFEGCEYRIADIQLGLVRLEGVTGWFDPSMMSAAVTRESLKRQIDISESVRHNLEQEIDNLSLQLAAVTRERDAEAVRADAAIAEANDLRTKLATAEADAAAMREALSAGFMTGESNSPEMGRYRVVIAFRDIHSMQRCHTTLVHACNGTAGRELLDRLKKLEIENADWRTRSIELMKRYTNDIVEPDCSGTESEQVCDSIGLRLERLCLDVQEQKQAIDRHKAEIAAKDAEIERLKSDDDDLLRKLRELLNGKALVKNPFTGIVSIETNSFSISGKVHDTLIAIRDGGK